MDKNPDPDKAQTSTKKISKYGEKMKGKFKLRMKVAKKKK